MEKIGVTCIGTVTAQGTEEERRDMFRGMGSGMSHPDTQEVGRLRADFGTVGAMGVLAMQRDALQARVAELEAELAARSTTSEES